MTVFFILKINTGSQIACLAVEKMISQNGNVTKGICINRTSIIGKTVLKGALRKTGTGASGQHNGSIPAIMEGAVRSRQGMSGK